MIFNSFNFIVLFPLIFLLYYAIPAKYQKARNLFLLVVSYLLYLQWKPVFALILLGVTAVTYAAALQMGISKSRKRVLVVGVATALLPLLFFKYFNFLNDSISELLDVLRLSFHLPGLNWAIPVGISFYTFQALAYLFDVYYKKQEAERNFLAYALFVSFFPSILMGPINRASVMLPQIKNLRQYFNYAKAVEGLKMILWGMFMKVVVADRVGLHVDKVLDFYEAYSGITCFIASIMYSVQIYADFGGYSLMAIGVGKTLGFEMRNNFRRPFFAHSVSDYWTRWHLSFSSWLKDYVYIPLGGSRRGKYRTYWNIFVTFLVSGIWHGANWTFILWGMWHSVCIILERMFNQQKCRYGAAGRTIKIIIAFMLVNFSRILFHMPTVTDAWNVMAKIFSVDMMTDFVRPSLSTMFFVLVLFVKDALDEFYPNRFHLISHRSAVVRWSTYVILILVIMLEGVLGADTFIYANF